MEALSNKWSNHRVIITKFQGRNWWVWEPSYLLALEVSFQPHLDPNPWQGGVGGLALEGNPKFLRGNGIMIVHYFEKREEMAWYRLYPFSLLDKIKELVSLHRRKLNWVDLRHFSFACFLFFYFVIFCFHCSVIQFLKLQYNMYITQHP